MARHRLERVQFIPRPREEVFAFFSDARNLERLTPEFLNFRILTPGRIEMRPGALIDYELRLHGLPVRWRTRIERFEAPRTFVDLQLSGPYRLWHHTHEFLEVAGGTQMRDAVDYELPAGPIGEIAHELWVKKQLERIFSYRWQAVESVFGPASTSSERTEPCATS
ncbi:MAG: SRPBCC family protein [bacterium]